LQDYKTYEEVSDEWRIRKHKTNRRFRE
jgi:hypothetical protein